MGWVIGGGLAGLLMSVLMYVGDHRWFPREAPLRTAVSAAALAVLGLQVGTLIRRRRA
ncbi:MAG: hypothetical protein M3003_17315 [Candidatus Dormibacteraeota bacterium]|nr:hypothetical protein [Candidatus Dormibacteraeota bacterium]